MPAVSAAFRRLRLAWSKQLDTLVHPCAQTEELEAPKHKIFLSGCFLSGALALVLLPLHLALAGSPNLALVTGCAWLLAHLPIALFLVQSGNLPRAYGLSSASFALFLTAIAWLSGGLASFALIWLAVVPMEATLSGSRRIILASAVLCAAMLLALAVLPAAPAALLHGFPAGYETLGTVLVGTGASLYMIALALRLTLVQSRQAARIAEDARKLSHLARLSRDVTCRLRPDGTAEVVAGSLSGLLAIPAGQTRGDWLFQRVLVGDRPAYLNALADVREGKSATDLTLRLRKGDREPGQAGQADYVPLRLRFSTETTQADDPAIFLTLCDEQKAAGLADERDEAVANGARQSEERSRFIATAAHELRTPLNAIIGFSDLMRQTDTGFDAQRQSDYAELINRSGKHLLQVVEDMLDNSALEAGMRQLAIEPVDLAEITRDSLAILAPLALERGISLQMDKKSEWAVIAADRNAVQQILINLLGNAIKFSRSGQPVRVACRIEGGEAVLEVQDSGCGIAVEDLGRLGTPFTRLAQRRDRSEALPHPEGAGLGLSIVKGLCALHEGRFALDSHLDKGTTARVHLPLGAPKQGVYRRKPAVQGSLVGSAHEVSRALERKSASAAGSLPVAQGTDRTEIDGFDPAVQAALLGSLSARAVARSRSEEPQAAVDDITADGTGRRSRQQLRKTA